MALSDIIYDYIKDKNSIVTSHIKGTTSLILYICNQLLKENISILYYANSGIDIDFVKTYYPRAYEDILFIEGQVDYFYEFLLDASLQFDYVVVDPGDMLLQDKDRFLNVLAFLRNKKTKVIVSSQVRIDIKTKQAYSTIEKINKSYVQTGKVLFDNSIWIRNVTEPDDIYEKRYIDVFEHYRIGNDAIARYIAKFTTAGYII